MSEFYHDNELERERSEDYYAGYYWGNNPYVLMSLLDA
jgi:hypothetical protein